MDLEKEKKYKDGNEINENENKCCNNDDNNNDSSKNRKDSIIPTSKPPLSRNATLYNIDDITDKKAFQQEDINKEFDDNNNNSKERHDDLEDPYSKTSIDQILYSDKTIDMEKIGELKNKENKDLDVNSEEFYYPEGGFGWLVIFGVFIVNFW
jgi:hypothetical protein